MNSILWKRTWLAGASLLAIALGLGEASVDGFSFQQIIPLTGYYEFKVAGADGGGNGTDPGGAGAVVGGELFLKAGDTLSGVVGGGGGSPRGGGFPQYGGSGGGGSFVFLGSGYLGGGLLFAAAGGDGQNFFSEGFPGQPGSASGGHPAGPASYGGFAGSGVAFGGPLSGPQQPAQPGSFPNGGAGACCYFGGGASGGFGGGGGGGYDSGGGGVSGVRGYGGGYSYVINAARNAFGITGGNVGGSPGGYGPDGYVEQLCRGPRAFNLGDAAPRLRRARLARSPAQAQAHAGLMRALRARRWDTAAVEDINISA